MSYDAWIIGISVCSLIGTAINLTIELRRPNPRELARMAAMYRLHLEAAQQGGDDE